MTSDIAVIQNQIDEISLRRSAAREYDVFNINISPNAPEGKISLDSLTVDTVTKISIGNSDKNSIISQPGAVDDLIDIESTTGEIVRFQITAVNSVTSFPDRTEYTVTKILGTRDLTLDETVNVYVYPQNSSYATVDYTTTQINTLQDQINAMQISVTAEQMTNLENSVNTVSSDLATLSTSVNNLATSSAITALQTQIDSNDTDITSINTNLTSLDGRITTLETDITTYTPLTDHNTLSSTVTAQGANITALQTQANTTESDLSVLRGEFDGLRIIHYSATPPSQSSLENGDFWFDTEELRILVRHGGAWLNPDRNADFDSTSNDIKAAILASTDFSDLQTRIAQL